MSESMPENSYTFMDRFVDTFRDRKYRAAVYASGVALMLSGCSKAPDCDGEQLVASMPGETVIDVASRTLDENDIPLWPMEGGPQSAANVLNHYTGRNINKELPPYTQFTLPTNCPVESLLKRPE